MVSPELSRQSVPGIDFLPAESARSHPQGRDTREEATGTCFVPKITIDYRDRCVINDLDHSQTGRSLLREAAVRLLALRAAASNGAAERTGADFREGSSCVSGGWLAENHHKSLYTRQLRLNAALCRFLG